MELGLLISTFNFDLPVSLNEQRSENVVYDMSLDTSLRATQSALQALQSYQHLKVCQDLEISRSLVRFTIEILTAYIVVCFRFGHIEALIHGDKTLMTCCLVVCPPAENMR